VHTLAFSRAAGLSFLGAVLAALTACGGSTGPSEPTQLVFKAGSNQDGPAGAALPVQIVVEARTSSSTLANVTISMSVESQGGGSVAPASAKTAANGQATFTWTLGPKIGTQTLTATSTGTRPVTASTTANAHAGAASAIIPLTDANQFVVVGHAVAILPSIKVTDALGNPIGGESVTFEVLQGNSVLTGAQKTSDASGVATLGGWTIGQDALSYQIRARITSGAVFIFEARGIPAALTQVAGGGQTVNAGTAVPILPSVKATRDDGSALANVPVTFTVINGGGSVQGNQAVTGTDGTAQPSRWILGTTPGPNRLEAATLGKPSINFDATGIAAVAANVVASGGTALAGFFGNYLTGVPEVTVTDGTGKPVAAALVGFSVTAGGGTLTGASALTDFQGKASITSWRLGASGTQTVSATTGAIAPVSFTAAGSAPPASTFRIEVRYPNSQPTTSQKAAFDAAAARWTQLILAGAPPYTVVPSDHVPGDTTCPEITGQIIDGIVIYADLKAIDGINNVLGSTGVCIIRDNGLLPVQAAMTFDTADLPGLETNGTLNLVILHEMGHALGFGTIWHVNVPGEFGYTPTVSTNSFLNGYPGSDPSFNGPAARTAFYGAIAAGTTFSGTAVPVEGSFGAGTRYSHWRETLFSTELMTGFLGPGLINPLSAFTVQQFHDLGYVVNDALADTYSFNALILAAGTPSFQIVEGELPGNITVINRQGGVVARIPRIYR
jgi:hypothetical protein